MPEHHPLLHFSCPWFQNSGADPDGKLKSSELKPKERKSEPHPAACWLQISKFTYCRCTPSSPLRLVLFDPIASSRLLCKRWVFILLLSQLCMYTLSTSSCSSISYLLHLPARARTSQPMYPPTYGDPAGCYKTRRSCFTGHYQSSIVPT